jgi:hypothetical protein
MNARAVVSALFVTLFVTAAVALPVAAAPPAVSLHVAGAPLDPGETHHTPVDPWVNVNVTAETELRLVEVRIDGVTRHAFEPASERFGRTVGLDLDPGRHRLTVVARAEEVTTTHATLIKDVDAPAVNYTAPFEGTGDSPDEPPSSELTVGRGNVSVNGTLADSSTVAFVRVEHRYTYREGGNDSRIGTEEYLLHRPGPSFNQSLYLTPGGNDVTLHVEDVLGNARTHEFTVAVDDTTPPVLDVTHIEWLSPTRLRIEGTATDRVQVDAIWATGPDTPAASNGTGGGTDARHHLVFPRPTAPDRDRRRVRFNTSVYHPRGADHVVVGTNDTAGNERTHNLSLSTFLAPTVRFENRTTGYDGERTVVVAGRVSDGQVANASVETLDPATAGVVDVRPLELGADGTFRTRLDAPPDETRVRVRVRDVSGAEHLATANVSAPSRPASTRSPGGGPGGSDGDPSPAGTADAAAGTDDGGQAGIRLPVVGVTVPLGPLAESVTLPVPVVGPFEVPVAALGALVVVLLGLGGAAGRYG